MQRAGVRRGHRLGLHAGDWVIVRSREEILATLDANARYDELPFQPEMLAYCGRRLRVAKVAHKTCDNIHKTRGRRMLDAVHLEGARCDGGGHGGCQADCVFFWKEAWLDRADAPRAAPGAGASDGPGCTEAMAISRARAPGHEESDDPVYVCQTTALYDATTLLHWWDVRQYIWDVTSGNHTAWHMAKLLLRSWYVQFLRFGVGYRLKIDLYNRFQRWRGGEALPIVPSKIPEGGKTPTEILDLQPGEWVQVKSAEEIGETITHEGYNRGMRYDKELLKYSGGIYQVQMRVDKIINEHTGQMMPMKNPCIQLENVYCRAECTERRLGCPRASNTYWREIWLRRVPAPASGVSENPR